MSELLPFLLVGLTTGAVYGLAATGLVLTYKTSGIFNFGHGAVGTVAAYVYYELAVRLGWSWELSFIVSVLVVGPLLGLLLERVAHRLAAASAVMKIVGTLGLVLMAEAGGTLLFGSTPLQVPQFLSQSTFAIGGLYVGYGQLIIIGISLAVVGGLWLFFGRTRYGTAMRAVVDNPELLASQGVSPNAVRRSSWLIGSTFATLSGVLLLPSVGLDSLVLTLLIIQAFGAAAIGNFSSLPRTYVGGLLVGIAVSIATEYVPSSGLLSALPSGIPFIVLFLVLVLAGKKRLASYAVARSRPRPAWRAPMPVQLAGGGVLLAVLLTVPLFAGTNLPFYLSALPAVILFLSLGLLVRMSKQISLAHMGFAAVGAAAFAHLAGMHVPWLLALIVAGLIAVPLGAVIAVPAIRLPVLFLALATFGFGTLLEQMFYTSNIMFGSTSLGLNVPRPSFAGFGSDRGYYYLMLVFVLVACAIVILLDRARFGRLLRGMGDAPVALSTLGTSTNVTRLMVFSLSAFLAAISGGLTAAALTNVGSTTFPSFSSLLLVAILALIPGAEPWYAFGGAFALYIIPSFFTTIPITNWLTLLFGIAALQSAMTSEVTIAGLPRLRALLDRLRRPSAETPAAAAAAAMRPASAAAPEQVAPREKVPVERGGAGRHGGAGLQISNLTVRFGGAVAVDDLSLEVPPGRITGLIGPNGAGKTTTFNASSGLVRPTAGKISLHGRDISRLSPPARARLGLGRTFQRTDLFDSLTVLENVGLGAEAVHAGANPMTQLVCSPADRARIRASAWQAMELCGITGMAGIQAGVLTTGQRRLVELARCLAGPYDLLLLDEPSSGLDDDESGRFGEILRRVLADREVGLLLVEHNMSLVMEVCDYLYVMDFGRLIEKGTPEQIAASQVVRDAYLGANSLLDEIPARVTQADQSAAEA
ncbi:MAG TPA: branched-chain amino acid ABC transporter permease/ATP-binding protein [Trebonia sp.]|nr:branched-chain amino acid ABC transporter permease/ATP-binding protein [Trebonia sp.]